MDRTTNVGEVPGATFASVPADEEFAAHDQLGPLARATLRDAPIKILAATLVANVRQAGMDPARPDVDERVAEALRAWIRGQLMAERGPLDADLGLRPLVSVRRRRR